MIARSKALTLVNLFQQLKNRRCVQWCCGRSNAVFNSFATIKGSCLATVLFNDYCQVGGLALLRLHRKPSRGFYLFHQSHTHA